MHKVPSRGGSLAPKLIAILALPLALYALYATGQKAVESYHLSQSADQIRAEIRALQAENLRLQDEIERARSDVEIERMARENLGLVMPDDQALIVVGPTAEPTPLEADRQRTAPLVVSQSSPTPMWRQWWNFFFAQAPDEP